MTTRENRWNRQVALRVLGLSAAVGLAYACSDHSAREAAVSQDDGSLMGEFVQQIARFEDETTETTYFLRMNGDVLNQKQLIFEYEPKIFPMRKVKVWGLERDGRIIVDRIEELDNPSEGSGVSRQALINPVPITPTKLAMVVVDIGGGPGTTTPDSLNAKVFTNADSVKAYYLENSYRAHDLVGKVIPTTMSYPMTTCDTSGMAKALRPMIDADIGMASDIYLWYFGTKVSACSWSGLSSGKDTYYNGSSGCVVLVQEPGHSFGMAHSSSMACKNPAGEVVPILDDLGSGDATTCVHSEYGNPYDTMGGGCRHFNAYNKVYRTYFQKCNGVLVRQSGTFNLMPLEKPCDGIQVLQVPMPKVRGYYRSGGGGSAGVTQLGYYTVELRTPYGFDTGMKPTVIINASPKFSVANTTGTRGGRGEHTWLLDMAPTNNPTGRGGDGTAHALAVGQTFTDPGGNVAITTMSAGNDGAIIKVDITGDVVDGGGQTVCLDGTPISAPGPETCGDDGGMPPPPVDVVTPPPPTSDSGPRPPDAAVDTGRGGGGAGGASGTGGGGTSGTGGSAGAGTAGAGTAGSTGTGGSAGTTTGTGGSTTTGTAGSGPTTTTGTGTGGSTTGGLPPKPEEPQGGCGCRVPGERAPASRGQSVALLGLAMALFTRRRRRVARSH